MDTYLRKQSDEELQMIMKDTEGCTSIFIGMIRDLVESELKDREEKKRREEEANKPKDKYAEMLYKLFLKGIIDEEQLEEKMEQRKNK